jgi:two-component system cell cycle sensor histidine kinase/response regulator CckA
MTTFRGEQVLQLFAEQTRDMIFRCRISPIRAWEYLSPSCAQLTGYTVEEHFADPTLVFKVVHPDDLPVYDELLRDPDRYVRPTVVRWIRKDGTVLWVEEQLRFVRDDTGAVVAVEGIARDITERKRAEAQLAEAQRIAQIGSWSWDLDRDEIVWSDELRRIFGVARDGVGGSYEALLSMLPAEEREPASRLVQQAIRDRQAFSHVHRIVRPDGEVRILHVRGQVFTDQDGRAVRVAGTAQDVTERRRLEQRVLAADRLASLGLLAGGLAHEINNPLTFMAGSLELLRSELRRTDVDPAELAATVNEYLEILQHGTERITRIVGELRLYARGDEAKAGPVDLRRVVSHATELTRNEVRHRARLTVELADVPLVEGNEVRLSQVLVNLIVNAAQAIRDGAAEENEIRIAGRLATDGRVAIEVRDTGAGIPPSVRHRIFEPFFTTKANGAGTGLGLAICHALVASMGGEIEVESEIGNGSTFRVLLKASLGPANTPSLRPSRAPELVRVLIVDDEILVSRTLGRLLEREQLTVSTADGRQALDLIAAGQRFDAILCDVMMPEVSGIDVYQGLLRSAPDQARRLIFMSGGAFAERARELLAGIPNPRLDKPIDVAQVHAAVGRVLALEGLAARG